MGSVIPLQGTLYLDSNCFIYSIERIEPYQTLLQPVWESARDGYCSIVTSELTVLETLVKPMQSGNAVLEQAFRALLQETQEVTLLPITLAILEQAARFRAISHVKTPDAIHAASSLAVKCSNFLTNDIGFRRIAGLPVTILSETQQIGQEKPL
jgi:predicted nucleic acid-binding protein